jgi:glycosyltransferase involved in cell wall biosynthesis
MTSLHEGFGIVFMEAMNFGLPIISTNHGGQTDFLTDGENALLINVGDHEACAASIERIVKDEKLRRRFASKNLKVVKSFMAHEVAGRYIDIFSGLR